MKRITVIISAALLLLGTAVGLLIGRYTAPRQQHGPHAETLDDHEGGDAWGRRQGERRARRLGAKTKAKRQTAESQSRAIQLKALTTLGYIDGTYDRNRAASGVIRHDPSRAAPGLNLYQSRPKSEAQLIDNTGKVVHRWFSQDLEAWQHVQLLPGGDLLVMIKDGRLFKLDKDSRELWSYSARVHHDLAIDDAGNIHVLTRKAKQLPEIHATARTLVDQITTLTSTGRHLRTRSVLKIIRQSPLGALLPSVAHLPAQRPTDSRALEYDILHTNHIEIFDGRLAPQSALFQRGNMLISVRNINAIAILDGETAEVVWFWGPSNVTFQHHPRLLENGQILLFDNGIKQSRVLEINPLTYQITWAYNGDGSFYSESRGSVQRLPNGNTLITESDKGYVIEVTPDQKTVWRFANPDINDKGIRQAIWRMTRFAPDDPQITFLGERVRH